MPDLTPDELTTLARYFAEQCSIAEAARVAQWLAADPARRAEVETLRAEWAASGFLLDGERVDALWRRLESDLRVPTAAPLSLTMPPRRAAALWRIAAGIALVAGAAGLWVVRGHWTTGADSVAALPTNTIAVPRGRRARFRLPDGTEVVLGPASTLRYAFTADRGSRSVALDGSAYFAVTHDAQRPFQVRTPYGSAKDLGTRFAVRAYPTDSAIDVVVAEGKVALRAARGTAVLEAREAVLVPGDRGRVAADGAMFVERRVEVNRYLAWTDGRLEFEDTPLAEAIEQIGRWYDLDVRLADSVLGSRKLTAVFRQESVGEVLRLISASAGIRVERRGQLVILHAR